MPDLPSRHWFVTFTAQKGCLLMIKEEIAYIRLRVRNDSVIFLSRLGLRSLFTTLSNRLRYSQAQWKCLFCFKGGWRFVMRYMSGQQTGTCAKFIQFRPYRDQDTTESRDIKAKKRPRPRPRLTMLTPRPKPCFHCSACKQPLLERVAS